MGRARSESSLLGSPDAKFFCGKPGASKKSALGAARRTHFANAGFSRDGCRGRGSNAAPSPATPSRLQMRSGKHAFQFSNSRQRSTLERPNFCLKNAEHLNLSNMKQD